MVISAMSLFVLEAWRHHGPPVLALIYAAGVPFVFPPSTMFQTMSVYFCVAATIDCFINVVLPDCGNRRLCTPKRAFCTVLLITVCSVGYNIPHCFELYSIACYDPRIEQVSMQVCPTEMRQSPKYYKIYYTYLYTIFIAVGPLLLLIVLITVVVMVTVCRKNIVPKGDDSDTISLILVVFLFISCNSAALLINFLELMFYEQLASTIIYLVDASNFLVVCNSTVNFFIYLLFGKTFKRALCKELRSKSELTDQTTRQDSPLTFLVFNSKVPSEDSDPFVWTQMTNGPVSQNHTLYDVNYTRYTCV